jgi:flavin reductase (DIM6/NTAB) family NADH-FMN oxidoreductase RutF
MSDPVSPGSIFALTNHELYIVTAAHDGVENGQIATWIMPSTLVKDRPRIVAVFSPQNRTHDLIEASGRFVLNMLADDQYELVPLFGLASGRDFDKFDGMTLGRTSSGLPVIPGACGWAECLIVASNDAGDRRVYIADIVEQHVLSDKTPLRKNDAFRKLPMDIRLLLEQKHSRDGERDSLLIRRFG